MRVGEKIARAGHIVPLVVLNLAAFLVIARILNGVLAQWTGDNVQFLILAEALANGEGYVDLHIAGTPPHTHYPPLFPLLLAPFVALGAPLIAIKGWVAAMAVAGLNVSYFFFASSHGRAVALLVATSTLCCGAFLDAGLSVMSESPYFLLSMAALWQIRVAARRPERRVFRIIAAALLVVAAILTRTIGIVLIPAAAAFVVVAWLTSRRLGRRLAWGLALGILVLATVGPWAARVATRHVPGGESYVAELVKPSTGAPDGESGRVSMLSRPVDNLRDYWRRLVQAKMPEGVRKLGPPWVTLVSIAFLAICAGMAALSALGWVAGVVSRRQIQDFYLLFYGGVLMVWITGGTRLLLPVLPLLFGYCYDGVIAIARLARGIGSRKASLRPSGRSHRVGLAVLGLLLVVNVAITSSFPLIRNRVTGRFNPLWRNYVLVVCELGSMARPGELVITRPSNLPYYLVEVQAVPLPSRHRDSDAMIEAILESSASFLIVSPYQTMTHGNVIKRTVKSFPEHFVEVAQRGRVKLYRIVRGDADPRPLPIGPPRSAGERFPRCKRELPLTP